MLPIVSALLGNGLANAALSKGTAYVKERTGIDLDKPNLSDKEMISLKQFEMEHEEELMSCGSRRTGSMPRSARCISPTSRARGSAILLMRKTTVAVEATPDEQR